MTTDLTKTLSCDWCGACCDGQHLLPLTGNALDGRHLPLSLKEPMERMLDREVAKGSADPDGPCVWFDMAIQRCRHYRYRPSFCREFEVGGEDCLRIRREAGIDDDD